jgi:hypothetical protein
VHHATAIYLALGLFTAVYQTDKDSELVEPISKKSELSSVSSVERSICIVSIDSGIGRKEL